FAGEEKCEPGNSGQACVHQPELRGRHFFEKTADDSDQIVPGKKRQIINSNDRGRERLRGDTRVKRERNRKNIGESGAVQNVESDEPSNRHFISGLSSERGADRERKHTGDSDDATNGDLCDLRRFTEFFRPKPPERDRDKKKTD